MPGVGAIRGFLNSCPMFLPVKAVQRLAGQSQWAFLHAARASVSLSCDLESKAGSTN